MSATGCARRALAATIAVAFASSALCGQAAPELAVPEPAASVVAAETGSAPTVAATTVATVLPPGFRSQPKENPWRRFEIIAFGAFPIILFYVDFAFDTVKYASKGFDPRYLPWPFKGDNAIDPEEGEYLARLGVAAGASLVFSGIDAWIRETRYRKETAVSPLPETPPELDSAPRPD